MTVHVVQIEKHKFVCGLFWQSLSRPRELWKEARALAGKVDSDLLVIRRDQAMAQAGYARSQDGVRRGYYSLAAVISKTIAVEGADYDGRHQPTHNWLGAFKLPDGMWFYCAVRDANFLPNGDFAGTKEQIMDRLLGDYALGGWNVVIGDPELEEYGFHSFSAKTIDNLIPRTKRGLVRPHKWWGLTPVKPSTSWKKLGAGGAAAAVVGTLGLTYWHHLQQKKEEQERALAMQAVRQRMMRGQSLPQLRSHPWKNAPLPSALAAACMSKFTLLAPGGWHLDSFECGANGARYAWSRNGSSVAHLLHVVPDAKVDLSGNKASYSEALNVAAGGDEELEPANAMLNDLVSRFQMLDIALALTAAPPQAVNGASAQPAWHTYSMSARLGALTPPSAADILNRPGVRLAQLSYRGGAWSIKGAVYAK